MLKIGSAVHTAHGTGTITDVDTVRGRSQYRVAGQGFSVWIDETKLAALGDVDESNSTTLPYDYEPQHPTETFGDEQTITPDHDIDADDLLSPTNSVTGESESLPYPGPAEYLFASRHYADAASPGEGGSGIMEMSENGLEPDQLMTGIVMPTIGTGIQALLGDAAGAENLTLNDPGLGVSMHGGGEDTTAFNPGPQAGGFHQKFDTPVQGDGNDTTNFNPGPRVGSIHTAGPGSFRHYVQWANDSGLHPGDDQTADLYGQTHGVDGFNLMQQFNSRRSHRVAAGGWGDVDVDQAQKIPGEKKPSAGSFDHYVDYANRNGMDASDELTADRYSREHTTPLTRATDYASQFSKGRKKGQPNPAKQQVMHAGHRPAGLSDKYIHITADTTYGDPVVDAFQRDPVGTIQRTAYLDSTAGLDPRVGQYMDLVDADPMIRQAAWKDVREKAMRLRREGNIEVKSIEPDQIYASVRGDNGVYDVMIKKGGDFAGFGGGHSISHWRCACEWGRWAFKRQHKFVGRLCSHGLATYYTMLSSQFKGQPRLDRMTRPHKRRKSSSALDEYKRWVKEVNKGSIDVPSADAFIVEMDNTPTASEAKAIYDYVNENMSVRPERIYDVDGYTFDPDKVWEGGNGEDNSLLRAQGRPHRLSPDLYRVPEGEGQYFTDLGDDRKTTGPNQIMAKVDKKWAKDHADLDDEKDPIVHFSMRKEALTYTADENLLQRLRDLSAESNAENAGNMKQHNAEIAEVIDELHERGYDANRLVAMVRTATADEDQRLKKVEETRQNIGEAIKDFGGGLYNLFGGGEGPAGKKYTPSSPVKAPSESKMEGGLFGDAAGAEGASKPSDGLIGDAAGAGGAKVQPASNTETPGGHGNPSPVGGPSLIGGGGGGSNWKPNGNMDPIGPGEYKIQTGDTYSQLAERAGWGDDYQGFADATGYQADNPDLIFAGDTINVPGKPGEAAPPAPGAEPAAPPAPEPGGAPPTSGTPGAPPAPSPADSTSGLPAPDPGVGGSTNFAAPATPSMAEAIADPAAAMPNGQLTNPGLTARRRYFFAEEDEELKSIDYKSVYPAGENSAAPIQGPGLNGDHPNAPAPANPAPAATPNKGVDPAPATPSDNTDRTPQQKPPVETVEKSDASKVLEDRQPQNAYSTSGGFGAESFMPILEGVGSVVAPLVTNIAGPIASGIGNAIGQGFSNILGSNTAADGDESAILGERDDSTIVDPGFAGSGPSRKLWYSTSEDYLDGYEYDDVGHMKQSDIVRQFQANIEKTALASDSGGGAFSDEAIANAARGFLRTAGRVYSQAEQQELMDEEHPQGARNLNGLDLRGTHYLEG